MSHAKKADKLLIKPAAGARPASPCTRGGIIPKARTRRPVTDESHATRRHQAGNGLRQTHSAESHSHPRVGAIVVALLMTVVAWPRRQA